MTTSPPKQGRTPIAGAPSDSVPTPSEPRQILHSGTTKRHPLTRSEYRRQQRAERAAAVAGFAAAGGDSPGAANQSRSVRSLDATEIPIGTSARAAWVAWLSPHFTGNDSCYFTGTYSDDYGFANGLTLPRNVHKDFDRFLGSFDYQGDYIIGVEEHAFRDVLHCHAILAGPFTAEQRRWVRDYWAAQRGHARALPVLDGCASYVTKYALKGDTQSFEWRLQ